MLRTLLSQKEESLKLKITQTLKLALVVWLSQPRIGRRKQKKKKDKNEREVLKVASKSNPTSVAGALAGVIREEGKVELQAIGAGAINQSVKAIAISRGYVAPSGIDLICVPAFVDIEIDGEERTAIKFIIQPR
jgi:stage V sporulation protein S